MTHKRPPVVVVMGHVDHGKTTLLDYIRKTNVAEREAGGITQSIGAYEIAYHDRKITFIDTPGHEAFSKMRGHGARVADLAILVVAADDGVKPQTKEALVAIGEAKLSYIVAINKIDKAGAEVERVKQELGQASAFLEGYGGDISWHAISAKTGEGVPELLDLVLLATDIQNLTSDPGATAKGVVLSSRLDPRRGLLVGIIVKDGTLRAGDTIGTGTARGKVKVLENFLGKSVKIIEPSAPALVAGFESSPSIGEEFAAGAPERVEPLILELRRKVCAPEAVAAGETGETVNVILKADEAGSLEALADLVARLPSPKPLRVVGQGVGFVYENDVKLAATTSALIVGFRTKVDRAAENLAEAQRVTVLTSPVIYELERALKEHLAGRGGAKRRALEVLKLFGEPRGKERIVGGRVAEGPVKNHEPFEVSRGGRAVGEGKILNLQSNRVDVPEAPAGTEAGLLVESEINIEVGDILSFPS